MTGLLHAVVLGVVLAAPVEPQTPLTLDQAIAEALKAQPDVQAARAALEASRGERRQAAVRPNPELSFEQREQAGGSDRQTSIALDVPLDLFRRAPRIESADRASDRAAAQVRDRERLLAAAVRDRYGEAIMAERRLGVMDAVVGAARRTWELLGNRVSEGAAPAIDRDLALVELRRLEGERALEAGRFAVAISGLKVLLGRPPSSALSLAETLERLVTADIGDADRAAGDRPDVQAAAADLDMARADVRLAQQGNKPEFSVFGGYMRMDAGFPQSGIGSSGGLEPVHGIFHNVAAGVKMSIPLFDRAQGTVAAAKARETAAAQTLAGRRLAAAGELDAAAIRLAAARDALSAYSESTRSLARRNLDVVRETYTLGRATLLDVLAEQRRFLEFEGAYTSALAEAFAASTDLQRAKGEIQ